MTHAEVAAPGPLTSIDPRIEGQLARAGRVSRWVAVGYWVLVLVGFVFSWLGDRLPEGPPAVRAVPVSAVVVFLAMALASLLAGDSRRTMESATWLRRVGLAMSVLVAVFGAIVAGLFLLNVDWPLGEVRDGPSFAMAINALALGIAVPLTVSRNETSVVAGQVSAFLVFSLSAVIFLGYAYGEPSVGRIFRTPEVSFQASLGALLIAVGVVLIRPGSGLLSAASSPGAGGRTLRRFGPVVLLAPALLLLLVETMPARDRVDALALVAVALGLLLLALLGILVRAIDRTAVEAATAGAEAVRAQAGLSQEAPLANSLSEVLHLVDIPGVEGWEVATRFRPAEGVVTGDASAVRSLPDGTGIAVVLVDVTGHGAEPALRAIRIRDMLLYGLTFGQDPSDALSLLGATMGSDDLASVVAVRLDTRDGRALLASAGHPPAIFVSTQTVELLGPTGPLLFLDPATRYGNHEISLTRGDSLVLFSDGIADVQSSHNGRTEPEILADLLLAEGGLAGRTADLVLGFGDDDPSDDQSAIVIRLA